MSRRPLLILSCSATKRRGRGAMSAYTRYDGPAYRVLRASGFPGAGGPSCHVRILSAEYGLLSPWSGIWDYDRAMDAERASELADTPECDVLRALFLPVVRKDRSFEHFAASEVFVWGGALYRDVVRAWEERGVFSHVPGGVRYSEGGIGAQLGQLKSWLEARRLERAS